MLKYNHDDIEDDQIRRKNIYKIYYSVNVTFTVLKPPRGLGCFGVWSRYRERTADTFRQTLQAFSELNPDTLAGRGNAPTQHLSAGTNLANNKIK